MWVRVAAVVAVAAALAAAWIWTPLEDYADPERLSARTAELRGAWYGGPVVVLTFLLLELFLFPLLVLVVATGIVFGPWLGPIYALAGSLASAAVGFGLGRWLGRSTIERLAGRRVERIDPLLRRNGVLAVFLVRKIPLPFTLVNLILGSSAIRFRDFMIGSLLGLGVIVVLLSSLGHQLAGLRSDPSPRSIALAALLVIIPFLTAWFINRRLRLAQGSDGSA
jgi:uncharacterized membrane protein YdjX (TVP38/TMEM64 family)